MTEPVRHHHGSVEIAASPQDLYDLVTDIARTGEWSPICRACSWRDDVDAEGPRVGDWFVGRNEADGRVWETESQVVRAEPGREFAWLVGGEFTRWGYLLEPLADGHTRLTESWDFLPAGRVRFHALYPDADRRIDERDRQAAEGIAATLATIKRIAESDGAGSRA
jgi:Polyketide cyclase / dehydrase and lipid transport